MNTLWNKLLCVILSLALLINLLPVSALALETSAEQATVQHWVEDPPVAATEKTTQPLEIVSEDVSKRTEFYKEFVLSNGLRMATLYAEPVHYSEDGQWKEIDNTLKLADGAYTNTAGKWKVSFPQQLTNDKAVSITKDGYTLSFYMAGALYQNSTSLLRSILGSAVQEQPIQLQSFQTATAQLQTLDKPVIQEETLYPQAPADKTHARLQYADVSTGTDIVYDLKGNQVKESIILDSYNAKLQGYRYTLNVGELNPVLTDSGEIQLYDRDNKQIVMVMPAPFLVDDAGEYCYDVELTLTGTGSQYTLTYQLPQQWLADSARQWPVVLDPVVNASIANNNIKDVSVYENNPPNDHTSGVMDVGHNTTYGKMRAFLKYDNLPALSSSDIIVNASLLLYKPNDHSTTNPVEVHKVTSTWSEIGMTWSNQPGFNTLVEDYDIVKDHGYYFWEITDVVRGWYEGQNTGLMLKAPNWVETTTSTSSYRKQFYSSDYYAASAAHSPALAIVFRNNNGLEGYWDYTSSSAGRAGTGYVNDYTGNLVWVHSDMGFGGNRMPVSINHVYNANDSATNAFGLGYGWRTNYNQLAYKCTLANLDKEYYVWEDADGTDHYFYYDNKEKKYVDEDGLELTLTLKNGIPEKITDKEGNTSYFDAQGRLYKLENNQNTKSSIQITYTNAEDYLISTITDGAGRKYQFTYSSDNLLTKITYTGSNGSEASPISYLTYTYSNGCPTKITYQDSKFSQFTYSTPASGSSDPKRLLLTAQDIDGYKLIYTYTTQGDGKPSRVKTVKESHNGEDGSTLTLDYAHNQTTFTETAVIPATATQNQPETKTLGVQIKQFNNLGNTTSVRDNEGRAQFANYATNDPSDSIKSNQLMRSSKLQNTVGNLLKNSNFEDNIVWAAASEASRSITTEAAYLGSKSLKYTKLSNKTLGGIVSGGFPVKPGETYTFSVYVKTGANANVWLSLGPDATKKSETLGAGTPWTRIQMSYTNDTDAEVTCYARVLSDKPGPVYVDCAQIELAETASRYNIIENGDFRYDSYGWIMSDYCDSNEKALYSGETSAPELSKKIFQIVGDPQHKLRIRQEVPVSGAAGDTYVLAGWARGEGIPLTRTEEEKASNQIRQFTLRGSFMYTDGDTEDSVFEFEFNPDTGGELVWQYAAGVMVAKKPFSGIKIQVLYDFGANTVYFDGIQLYKEEFGNSYTYDDDGNVISVKDLQGQTTDYEYASNNTDLLRVLQNNKAKVTYEYDGKHNVTKATTETGIVYEFAYDPYGNNTSVSIKNGTTKITSTAVYKNLGNQLDYTIDALGNKTTYGYNADTNVLEWVQYPNDTPDTRTEYTYDEMYRVAQSALTTDSGLNLSAQYTYTNDLLTSIQTPSTTYNFEYGNFGLRSSVKVGTQELAGYSYESGTNRLEELDYGNEGSVQYTYDDQGRVTQQTYEDGAYVTYKYDNSGALAKVYDSETGTTSTYYYDFTDRMMKYVEKSGSNTHSVGYTYDNLNNLTALKETFGDTERIISYAYDGDNRPTSITAGNSTLSYTYDAYGRVSTLTPKHDGNTFATKEYTYKQNANGAPTNQVSVVTISDGDDNPYYTATYTYDQNGNITGINTTITTEGQETTYATSYAYDSANQLIREDNQEAGTTTFWTYNNAGNILTRTVHPYDDVREDNGTQTRYIYNSEWGDQLKVYNSRIIHYDEVGNPLSDYTWDYTWQHGRQLASMVRLGTSEQWQFTYNADGLRTQRTNGNRTYQYTYNGDKLTHMTVDGHTMYFTYDASGSPMSVTYDGEHYYYVTNLQGDVIAIVEGDGDEFVRYTYDAWGNPLPPTGDMADAVGFYNPLRYRGYVYDPETELYYLQSRYYNPEMGRFINADAFPSTGQGFNGNNMFAYCANNPVSRTDTGGYFWDTVFDVISLCFSIAEVIENPDDPMAWLGVAADVASLIIPCISGGGALVRATTKIDDVVDVAKTVDNLDEVGDAGKAISKSTKNARASAVRKAWKNEVTLVESTGKGTRSWTVDEIDELLNTGKVKGYVGHHMKSVKGYPKLAGDPLNIQFLTRKEHFLAHGGNWRNITHGRYVP